MPAGEPRKTDWLHCKGLKALEDRKSKEVVRIILIHGFNKVILG